MTGLEFKGIQTDADLRGAGVAGGDAAARRRWRELTGLEASALERGMYEAYGITAVSADLALVLAHRTGVPVLEIDQSNLPQATGHPLGLLRESGCPLTDVSRL